MTKTNEGRGDTMVGSGGAGTGQNVRGDLGVAAGGEGGTVRCLDRGGG